MIGLAYVDILCLSGCCFLLYGFVLSGMLPIGLAYIVLWL